MIPKIIHQIWIQGFDEAPDNLKSYSTNCQKLNNDFKHVIWDDVKIKDLLLNNFGQEYVTLYEKYTIFAQKADFARYAILYLYGGIYLDMDMVCRKNLTPFLKYNFFCTTDAFFFLFKRYLNGIIGTIPKHPLFLYVFKNIFERQSHANNVTYSTGTGLLYDSVQQYKKSTGNNDIEIIDSKYLHPCQTYDDDSCPYTCDSCFVAHVNTGSWNSDFVKFFNKYFMKNLKIIFVLILIVVIFLLAYKLGFIGFSDEITD